MQRKAAGGMHMGGFRRIAPLLSVPGSVSEAKLALVRAEVWAFLNLSSVPHKRLGDSLRVAGAKQSYQLWLFGRPTAFSTHFRAARALLHALAEQVCSSSPIVPWAAWLLLLHVLGCPPPSPLPCVAVESSLPSLPSATGGPSRGGPLHLSRGDAALYLAQIPRRLLGVRATCDASSARG